MKKKNLIFAVPFYSHGRKILLGASTFIRETEDFLLTAALLREPEIWYKMEGPPVAAILTSDPQGPLIDYANERSIPLISLLVNHPAGGPMLGLNEERIGEMAAEYFLDRGFSHFGFVGSTEYEVFERRSRAFNARVRAGGLDIQTFSLVTLPSASSWSQERGAFVRQRAQLGDWLKGLPKPAAVLCANDDVANEVVAYCYRLGIRVPEEASVLGVGDDDLLCQISHLKLSSIRLPFEQVGYSAARFAVALSQTGSLEAAFERVPEASKSFDPIMLVHRESAEYFAVGDELLRRALTFIQDRASLGINVNDVLQHVNVSRPVLERRFKEQLGRTPLAEIRR